MSTWPVVEGRLNARPCVAGSKRQESLRKDSRIVYGDVVLY